MDLDDLIWELALVITIVLAVLKAFGYITCSWLIVFMPVLIIVSILVAILLFYVFYCICDCADNSKCSKNFTAFAIVCAIASNDQDDLWLKYFSKRKSK